MTQGRTDVEWLLAQGEWMRSLARGLLCDHALAEDVVQESYAAALTRGPRALGPDRERLRPWLAAVVGNLARRARGRAAARAAVEERGARAEATEPADELVARMELQRALAEAVLALDEPYRSAVLLRHVENLDARESARRQGCTRAAARQRVARGLERLRQTLDRRPGGRAAWAVVLAPLCAPASLAPSATVLGGMLMGSKLTALVLAGASLVVFAFVYSAARGSSESASARGPRELTPARLALDSRSAELVAPAVPAASARQALEELQPASVALELSGLVHDSYGRPLAGANLVLAVSEAAAAAIVERAQPDPRWSTSDALGAFRLRVAGAPESPSRALWASSVDYLPGASRSDSAPLDVLLRARPARRSGPRRVGSRTRARRP
jgi:RNA polymerase sigma-70 factor (ECF subfamily)